MCQQIPLRPQLTILTVFNGALGEITVTTSPFTPALLPRTHPDKSLKSEWGLNCQLDVTVRGKQTKMVMGHLKEYLSAKERRSKGTGDPASLCLCWFRGDSRNVTHSVRTIFSGGLIHARCPCELVGAAGRCMWHQIEIHRVCAHGDEIMCYPEQKCSPLMVFY